MADGGLLALIACLALAQLSHETTGPTQLASTALLFRRRRPALAHGLAAAGGPGSDCWAGAQRRPSIAVLLGLGCAWLVWHSHGPTLRTRATALALMLAVTLLAALLAQQLDLWRWRIGGGWAPGWQSLVRLLTWFSWPAWPLALWTLWRWRQLIASWHWHRHPWLPLWFALVTLGATLATPLTASPAAQPAGAGSAGGLCPASTLKRSIAR